jgi:hypothetical protein
MVIASGTHWPMTLQKRTRVLTAALASSLVLGLAACGDEDDVERNIEEGAQGVKEAGRDAKNAGEDAAKEAEKAGEDAAREAEESANDAQRELEE